MLDDFPTLLSRESWYVHGFPHGDPYWETFRDLFQHFLLENGAKKLDLDSWAKVSIGNTPKSEVTEPIGVGRFSVDTRGQWHLREHSHCLVHSAGLDLPVHSAVRKGSWTLTSCHRGFPFIILPPTPAFPVCTFIPLFFSSCLHFHMPSLPLLAAPGPSDPPSPVRQAPGPCGSQWPHVKLDSCLNRFTNLCFRRNQQFHQYFQVHWKSDLHHSHTIKQTHPSL